jgi:FkbM family methyltransferase
MHPLRKIVRRFGLDVHRFNPFSSDEYRLNHMLSSHGVNLVLDVGANRGQYATFLRDAGYRNRIVSFEPQADMHSLLVRASSNDPEWTIAHRVALGASRSTVKINLSRNRAATSLLTPLNRLSNLDPDSTDFIGAESVQIVPLDEAASLYISGSERMFLKLDVQGFEGPVLDGAVEVVGRAVGLQVEMTFVALYDGQALFEDLYRRVTAAGFTLWTILQGFCDMSSGRSHQCDFVFFRD